MKLARSDANSDPPKIRSIATFDFGTKVAFASEFPVALDAILAPLVSVFEQRRFGYGGAKTCETGVALAVFVGRERFVITIACQAPVSYEWAVWVDPMPGFLARVFDRPPAALTDAPPLRSLLSALDEALRSDPSVTLLGWHTKETLSRADLSSRAGAPFDAA